MPGKKLRNAHTVEGQLTQFFARKARNHSPLKSLGKTTQPVLPADRDNMFIIQGGNSRYKVTVEEISEEEQAIELQEGQVTAGY